MPAVLANDIFFQRWPPLPLLSRETLWALSRLRGGLGMQRANRPAPCSGCAASCCARQLSPLLCSAPQDSKTAAGAPRHSAAPCSFFPSIPHSDPQGGWLSCHPDGPAARLSHFLSRPGGCHSRALPAALGSTDPFTGPSPSARLASTLRKRVVGLRPAPHVALPPLGSVLSGDSPQQTLDSFHRYLHIL